MSDKVQEVVAEAQASDNNPHFAGIMAPVSEDGDREPTPPALPDCGVDIAKSFRVIKKIRFNLSIEDIIKGLGQEELVELVKAIDQHVAAWDFSEELHEYFLEQHHIHVREFPEDFPTDDDKEAG